MTGRTILAVDVDRLVPTNQAGSGSTVVAWKLDFCAHVSNYVL